MVDELHNEGFTGRLVAGEGGYRILRTIAVLLLLAGCGWSGYMFRQYIELNEEAPITIPPIESQSEKDAQRLDKVIGDFRTAVDTRTRSLTLASAVIEASRQPFIPTMKVSVAATQPGEGEGGVTVAGEDQVIPTYVREKIPPSCCPGDHGRGQAVHGHHGHRGRGHGDHCSKRVLLQQRRGEGRPDRAGQGDGQLVRKESGPRSGTLEGDFIL